jgi:hypothetical protein
MRGARAKRNLQIGFEGVAIPALTIAANLGTIGIRHP